MNPTLRDIRLTLIGKPGCHLCDDAREVVACVREELAATPGSPRTTLEERSIVDDEALRARYAEEIPVLLIDDEVHGYWRLDPVRLKTALLARG
ncbi:glutaredoxin family protein [Agromyces kandeliae]|uniref:glutaredoxin family protein n=1 Tax=Agromyces kandeliae TaxID=2666141 RepID=UPI002D21ECA7|nr:glutaredoxin family protein [Agromyces kandeliae]